MALPATDNFNRANGGLGTNWTTLGGTPQIISNRYGGTSFASFGNGAFWDADVFDDDQYGQAVIAVAPIDPESLGIVVRATNGSNYYVLSAHNNAVFIEEIVGGSYAFLGEDTAEAGVLGDVIRGEAEGTTLRILINGVEAFSLTDASLASGSVGLDGYKPHTNFPQRWDDFEAGNLVSGTTGTFAVTAPAASASFTGVLLPSGTFAVTAPKPTSSFTGVMLPSGTFTVTAPVATASFSGTQTQTGTFAVTAPSATAAFTGSHGEAPTGTFTVTAPSASASFTGVQTHSGSFAVTAPRATVSFTGWQAPQFLDLTETSFSTDATDHLALYPASVGAGDGILWLVSNFTVEPTIPAGLTRIVNQGNPPRFSAYWEIAAGDEGGTSLNFVTGSAQKMAVQAIRFKANTFSTPVVGFTSGDASHPNTPAAAPGFVFVYVSVSAAAIFGQETISSAPTGYAGSELTPSNGSDVALVSSRRTSVALAENPDAYVLADVVDWAGATILILGATASPTGSFGVTAPSASAAFTGAQTQTGTFGVVAPSATASFIAGVGDVIGSFGITAPSATASFTGLHTQTGTFAATAPSATASFTGATASAIGSFSVTAPSATASFTGNTPLRDSAFVAQADAVLVSAPTTAWAATVTPPRTGESSSTKPPTGTARFT